MLEGVAAIIAVFVLSSKQALRHHVVYGADASSMTIFL
jgi:hypothetical protein